MNLGEVVDKLHVLREKKRKLEVQVNDIETSISELEQQALGEMDTLGVQQIKGKKASLSKTIIKVFTPKDWDAYMAWIGKNKFYHMVQKRVSNASVEEYSEKNRGKIPPGLDAFEKVRLNLRSLQEK